jgi:hypothetical protein
MCRSRARIGGMTDEAEAPEKGGDGRRYSIRSEWEQGQSRAGNVWKAWAFRPGATQAARRGPKES